MNEAWREVVEVDEDGKVTRLKVTTAYHHGREKWVTLLGLLAGDNLNLHDLNQLPYKDGVSDNNQNPVRFTHYSWLRRNR